MYFQGNFRIPFLCLVFLFQWQALGQSQNDVIEAESEYTTQVSRQEMARSNYEAEKTAMDSLEEQHSSETVASQINRKERDWESKRRERETLNTQHFSKDSEYQKQDLYIKDYTRYGGKLNKRLEQKHAYLNKVDGGATQFARDILTMIQEHAELGRDLVPVLQTAFTGQTSYLNQYKGGLRQNIADWKKRCDSVTSQVKTYTDKQKQIVLDINKLERELGTVVRDDGRLAQQLQLVRQDYYTKEAYADGNRTHDSLKRKIDSYHSQIGQVEQNQLSLERKCEEYRKKLGTVHTQVMGKIPTLRKSRDQEFLLGLALAQLANAESEKDKALKKKVQTVYQKVSRTYSTTKGEVSSLESQRKRTMSSLISQVSYYINGAVDLEKLNNNLEMTKEDEQTAYQYVQSMEVIKRLFDVQVKTVSTAKTVWNSENSAMEAKFKTYVAEAESYAKGTGGKEGTSEGESAAQNDAEHYTNQGAAAGKTEGEKDGKEKRRIEGFRYGWDNAENDALKAFFEAGHKRGTDHANRKASLEDAPLAYNEMAKTYTQQFAPSNQTIIDITENLPANPGENSKDLKGLNQQVTEVPKPKVTVPNPLKPDVPLIGSSGIQSPGGDPLVSSCDFISVPNVRNHCRSLYKKSYDSTFSSAYRNQIKEVYNAAVSPAYNESFQQDYPQSYQDGLEDGAQSKGLMVGFEKRYQVAQPEMIASGKAAYKEDLKDGHLVVVRGVALEETSGDGIFSAGEVIKLTLNIDNYGSKETLKEGHRLRLTHTSGVSALSAHSRDLPAFDGNHRTAVKGVLTARVTAKRLPIHTLIKMAGVIEKRGDDGKYKTIGKFSAEETTKNPIEVVAVDTGGGLKYNADNNVKMTIQNVTTVPFKGGEFEIHTFPLYTVKFDGENRGSLTIPALEPGGKAEVTLRMKPGVWSNGKYVKTLFRVISKEDQNVAFTWQRGLPDNRSIQLYINDKNGKQVHVPYLKTVRYTDGYYYISFIIKCHKHQYGIQIAPGKTSDNVRLVSDTISTGANSLSLRYRMDVSKEKQGWVRVHLNTSGYQGSLIHGLQIQLLAD